MKKSLLALLISASVLITGCNEKEINALNTQISQLSQSSALAQKKITQLTQERDQLQVQLEQAKQTLPALQVEIEPLFHQYIVIKHDNTDTSEDDLAETVVQVSISMPKTSIAWLDTLLLTDFIQSNAEIDEQGKRKQIDIPAGKARDIALKQIQQEYDDLVKLAKEYQGPGMYSLLFSDYLGQRNNLITFYQLYATYSGGAHGMHAARYINIDVDKQKILTLNDLFSEAAQRTLHNSLWKNYLELWEDEPFIEPHELSFSEQFYFDKEGIVFVYAPYEIGPYAMGIVELKLNWEEINPHLPKAYQRISPIRDEIEH